MEFRKGAKELLQFFNEVNFSEEDFRGKKPIGLSILSQKWILK